MEEQENIECAEDGSGLDETVADYQRVANTTGVCVQLTLNSFGPKSSVTAQLTLQPRTN